MFFHNGISHNTCRTNNLYEINPTFWKTRPLTKRMIDRTSFDINKLFGVASRQLEQISDAGKSQALANSTGSTSYARDTDIVSGLVVRNPRMFIGKGGANIRTLQKRTKTMIYNRRDNWIVL